MKLAELEIGTKEVANLYDVWQAIDTQIYRVVDEVGDNVGNAQLRCLDEERWLYVDDQNGYRILTVEEMTFLEIALRFELRMSDDNSGNTITIDAESLEDAKQQAIEETRDWVEEGDWGNEGASIDARWALCDEEGDEVADGWLTVEIPVDEDAIIPETEVCD